MPRGDWLSGYCTDALCRLHRNNAGQRSRSYLSSAVCRRSKPSLLTAFTVKILEEGSFQDAVALADAQNLEGFAVLESLFGHGVGSGQTDAEDLCCVLYPERDTFRGFHILFDFENAGLIQLEQLPAQEPDSFTPFCVRFNNEKLNEAIGEWFITRDLWINGQLSDDAYQDWKDSFPSVSADPRQQAESSDPVESIGVSDSGSKAEKAENPIRKHFLLFQSMESRFISMTYEQEVPGSYRNVSAIMSIVLRNT